MANDWKSAVHDLADQVVRWVATDGSTRGSLILHELAMDPTPDVPLLEIEVDRHEILRLEPAAFAADKLPTTVYLYAYPTLRRAVLVGPDVEEKWDVQSSEGVPMNYPWSRHGFLQLVWALSDAHVPRSV